MAWGAGDGPLAGLRVVAIEHAVAAPLCTRHLAELGADVVKVERPDRGDLARGYDTVVDGQATHFVWLNAGKRSLALDVRAAGGHEVLDRLLDRADVLVANLGPGALERLTGRSDLCSRHPRLVACTISGYGTDGPHAHRKAYDLLVVGEAGVTRNTGTPDQPAKPGVSLADLSAGVYAFAAVLGALYERERTGTGQRLDVSLFDATCEWMMPLLLAQLHSGATPPPSGERHASICPYGPVPTADGQQLNIAVQTEEQWKALCRTVLGRPDAAVDDRFTGNANRLARRDDVETLVTARTRSMTAAQLGAALDDAGVPWGNLNDTADVIAHPQLVRRERWRPVTLPSGAATDVLVAPFMTPRPTAPAPMVPRLGEHTGQVLAELRFTDDEIQQLNDTGTVFVR